MSLNQLRPGEHCEASKVSLLRLWLGIRARPIKGDCVPKAVKALRSLKSVLSTSGTSIQGLGYRGTLCP